MSEIELNPPRITAHWRRFQSGLWRVAAGDIYQAYSASTMPRVAVFNHEGRLYTNGGISFSKWFDTEVNAYPLISMESYRGADSVPFSCEGRTVTHRKKPFRLGAKVIFVASDPTVDEWRKLIRALYADGGLFAADCTYAEFVGSRFESRSENGRAAAAQELNGQTNSVKQAVSELMRFVDGQNGLARQRS